jgi:hypothetical protein
LDEIGAVRDEAQEIEEDRDDREELSETMDSGDDIDETELANDERRCETYDCGEELRWGCHFSLTCAAQTLEA